MQFLIHSRAMFDWDRTFDESANMLESSVQDVPQRQFNFIIAGQRGAHSTLHIDATGLCTVVRVVTGTKYWLLRRPLKPEDAAKDVRALKPTDWQTVVLKLVAGDLL